MSKFLTVLRILLSVLLCPIVLLTLLSAVVRFTVYDPQSYTSFVDDSVAMSLTSFVRDELEAECLFYDLPFEVLDTPLSQQHVKAYAQQYADAMAKALLEGEEFAVPAVDESLYVSSVQAFFDSLPQEERPLDPKAAQTVGKELAAIAQSQMKAGLNDSWLRLAHRYLSHRFLAMLADGFFVLVAAVAVLWLAAVLVSLSHWRQSLYGCAFGSAVGSAFVAIPLFLLFRYGLPERLALMDSPLKLYIDGVLNALIADAIRLTVTVFIVLSVLLLFTVVFCLIPNKKVKEN